MSIALFCLMQCSITYLSKRRNPEQVTLLSARLYYCKSQLQLWKESLKNFTLFFQGLLLQLHKLCHLQMWSTLHLVNVHSTVLQYMKFIHSLFFTSLTISKRFEQFNSLVKMESRASNYWVKSQWKICLICLTWILIIIIIIMKYYQ